MIWSVMRRVRVGRPADSQHVWRDLQTTYAPAGTGEVQRQRLAENLLQQEEDGVSTRTPWSVLHAGRAQPPVTVQPVSV
jgi:hypothetical protein